MCLALLSEVIISKNTDFGERVLMQVIMCFVGSSDLKCELVHLKLDGDGVISSKACHTDSVLIDTDGSY